MEMFSLKDRAVAITGAAGLLGVEHAFAVGEAGGLPVLMDISHEGLARASDKLTAKSLHHLTVQVDLCDEEQIVRATAHIEDTVGHVWGLVNNVASNPVMAPDSPHMGRLEDYLLAEWDSDIRVGLTSAFLCAKHFGDGMSRRGSGSIVNVASDLAVIAPDQRIYGSLGGDSGLPRKKPASYSVVKTGLLGLTRYLATYWSPRAIRCNALSPGSVKSTQGVELIDALESRIPLKRLARPNEYRGAVVFLLSDASSYMTGTNLVIDGGRSAW